MFGLFFAKVEKDSDSFSGTILSQAFDLLEDTLKQDTYKIDVPNIDLCIDLLSDIDNTGGGQDREIMSGKGSAKYLVHF